ncbi:M56 family metallopeptidase [Pedobacter metabolipauper]|uniref:BlaR1 peptidase M56 n=1 Tax=Pedobacter metabolipauper TaxID=425513 RepID=A0A4R6SPL3_9SPHI|nr:M56 family metallopeptidase [Pedobacter metabolipauper]TDQ06567.1 BlaR1 peptidase M56 [Pedobacter metabolipauper]
MEWLTYLLKVSACTALFYALYHFFLQKLTFFSNNRYYLLSTLLISFLIPALQLEIKRDAVPVQMEHKRVTAASGYGEDIIDLVNPAGLQSLVTSNELRDYSWEHIVYITYWLIVAIILLVFAYQLISIVKHVRKVDTIVGRLKVVYKPDGFTNCSFLNYVFVDKEDLTDQEIAVFMQHENVHASRFHSIDKLLVAACKVLLWFNPVVYLYDKAIEQVHEYEADRETSLVIGSASYAGLLLSAGIRENHISLMHSFVKNPLKERIKMLFTHKSKDMKKLTYLLAAPVSLGLVWLFSIQVVYATANDSTLEIKINEKSVPAAEAFIIKERRLKELQSAGPAGIQVKDTVKTRNLKLPEREIRLNTSGSDSIRFVNGNIWEENIKVTVDGKSYDKSILNTISQSAIRSMSITKDAITREAQIDIVTINNKIEYATDIDKANAKIKTEAEKSNPFYARYPQKDENGADYDFVRIKLISATTAGAMIKKGEKVLILINGKAYSEEEAIHISEDMLRGIQSIMAIPLSSSHNLFPEYSKAYAAVIILPKLTDEEMKQRQDAMEKRQKKN